MSDHLLPQELEGWHRRTLSVPSLLAVDQHLSSCPDCLSRLQQTKASPALPEWLMGISEGLHPSYEKMAALLDSRLDVRERETLASHFSICPTCAGEMQALQSFEAQRKKARQRPVPAPARLRLPLGERVRQFFQFHQRSWNLACACALMLAAAGAISLRFSQLNLGQRSLLLPDPAGAVISSHPIVLAMTVVLMLAGIVGLILPAFRRKPSKRLNRARHLNRAHKKGEGKPAKE